MDEKEKDQLRKYANIQIDETAITNARQLSDRLVLLFKQSKGNKTVLLKGINDIFDSFSSKERAVIADFISALTNRIQFGDTTLPKEK